MPCRHIARDNDSIRPLAPNGFGKVIHRGVPASRIGRVDVQMQVGGEEEFHLDGGANFVTARSPNLMASGTQGM